MTQATVPHPLPDPLVDVIAQRFRVLAEPMRIKLLDRLRAGGATVGELTQDLVTSQQNVSKHLGVLRQAGIVARRRIDSQVRYVVIDDAVFELCEHVCGGLRNQLEQFDLLIERGVSR